MLFSSAVDLGYLVQHFYKDDDAGTENAINEEWCNQKAAFIRQYEIPDTDINNKSTSEIIKSADIGHWKKNLMKSFETKLKGVL